MSIATLATSYANRYANARPAAALAPAAGGAAGGAAAGQNPAVPGDVMQTLTSYIPSEIVTVYLAGISAIASFKASMGNPDQVMFGFFIACIALAAISAGAAVFVASQKTPPLRAIVFPAVAAVVAFLAYAWAIPGGPFQATYFGALAVLIVTPLLHACSEVYQRIFPPP